MIETERVPNEEPGVEVGRIKAGSAELAREASTGFRNR
jgi:hypothetical protein